VNAVIDKKFKFITGHEINHDKDGNPFMPGIDFRTTSLHYNKGVTLKN